VETEQSDLDRQEKVKTTVRMTIEEMEAVKGSFGGVQAAFNQVIKQAEEETGWIPVLSKRLILAYKAVRDAALLVPKQVLDSLQMRNAIMARCDCKRSTAVRHLHELKAHNLIYTFGIYGDENVHFVACSKFDQETIKKVHLHVKIDPNEYFAEKYGSLPLPPVKKVRA